MFRIRLENYIKNYMFTIILSSCIYDIIYIIYNYIRAYDVGTPRETEIQLCTFHHPKVHCFNIITVNTPVTYMTIHILYSYNEIFYYYCQCKTDKS